MSNLHEACGQWDKVPDETGGHRPGQGGSDHHVPQRAQNSKQNVLVECRQSEKREFHPFFLT